MLLATYHPPPPPVNLTNTILIAINTALDMYACSYDKVLLVGDFNAQVNETYK